MTDVTTKEVENYQKGAIELREILGFDADYFDKLKGRAQFFIEGGHHERALIMLDMIEELDRRDLAAPLMAVELLLKDGHSDAAEAKITSLEERFPDRPDVLVARAELDIAVGRMVPAAERLRRVLDNDPELKTDAGRRAAEVAQRAYEMIGG